MPRHIARHMGATVTALSTAALGALGVVGPSVHAANAPVQIIVFDRAGPEANGMAPVIAYWNAHMAAKTGITVTQVPSTRSDYYSKVNTILFSNSKTPDVVLSYSNYTGLYAQFHKAVNLTAWIHNKKLYPYNLNDFFPVSLSLVTYKGGIYGLPTDTNTYLLYYRKDLIKSPPQTYDQLFAIARKFTKSINPKSPTEYGYALHGINDESTAMFWFQIFRAYGGQWFTPSGAPDFASPAGIAAVNWVRKVITSKVTPPDWSSYDYVHTLSAMQSGSVATAINWDAMWDQVSNQSQSPLVYNKVAAALVPGVEVHGHIVRAQNVHDLMFVINPNSPHTLAAFRFIAWATGSPIAIRLYYENGGSPPHKSIFLDPTFRKQNPALAVKYEALMKYGYAEPSIPIWPEMKQILGNDLAAAFAGQLSAQAALTQADRQIAQLMRQKGYLK
jgi:multiple sugar transport system substrate-binding protein